MIKKFCAACNRETWHNPLKVAKASDTPNYRCTSWGIPKRYGGKNYALRVNGKIMNEPKP